VKPPSSLHFGGEGDGGGEGHGGRLVQCPKAPLAIE